MWSETDNAILPTPSRSFSSQTSAPGKLLMLAPPAHPLSAVFSVLLQMCAYKVMVRWSL